MDLKRKQIIGIFIVFIGLAFLFRNLGYLEELPSAFYNWPNVFLVLAIVNLFFTKWKQTCIFSTLWIFFTVDFYNWIDASVYWPLVLISVGIFLLSKHRLRPTGVENVRP